MARTSANQGLTRLSRGEILSNSFCHHQQLNQTQLNPETSVFSTEGTRGGGGSYLPRPSRLSAQTSLGWGQQSVKAVSVNLAGRLLITLLRASRSAQLLLLLLLRREASREL